MIQKKVTLLLIMMCLSTSSFAANYVSDELFTYTHNGPGTQYKIRGLVHAGDKLHVLSVDKAKGYTQIKDDKGRSVWVNSQHVSNKPGLKQQLENLNNKYLNLTEKLSIAEDQANKNQLDLKNNLNENINQVLELQKENVSLKEELKTIQSENNSLNDMLDNEKNELLMQWFSYGGMVAGLGLILGLILPLLIPTRKQKSRW